jgi:hypothetical protein
MAVKKKSTSVKLDANKLLIKMTLPKRPLIDAKPETWSNYEAALKKAIAHNSKVKAELERRRNIKTK